MAKKKIETAKATTDDRYVVEIEDGITVTVLDDAKKANHYYTQLKIARGILNPAMITFSHPDVSAICEDYGLNIRQFKKMDRNDKNMVMNILQGVQSHHADMDEQAQKHGGIVMRYDDIFEPGRDIQFRKDIQALADKKKVSLDEYITGYFAEEEREHGSPSPFVRNPNTPAEQKLALIDAFSVEIAPYFMDRLAEQWMGDGTDPQQLGDGTSKDENGFQPE